MCKKAILVFFLLFTLIPVYLYAFTPDQERQLFQTLGEIKGELRQINKRIDDTNKRIDDTNKRIEEVNRSLNERIDKLIDIMIGITATFAGLVGAMMGLVFWDRKTLITKAKEETIKEIEKEGRLKDLICALRKLAKNHHQIAEVLREFNLL